MSAKEEAFRIFMLMRTEICLLHDSELLKDKIAKNLANIAIDEIIKNQDNVIDIMRYKLILGGIKSITMPSDYWNNVKQEIQLL
jgi:hypothetical protein